jgi:glycosyltransferase involved in cell wall biosynthesis
MVGSKVTRLLILCHDVVDKKMAGPGIRYWEMARALSQELRVTLATPEWSLPSDSFSAHVYDQGDWNTIAPAIAQSHVVMLSGDMLVHFPQLATCGKPLLIEATYPYTFEGLQLHSGLPLEKQVPVFESRLATMRRAALAGDFFFCASQRQRAYWLGVLDAFGRINPHTYAADKSLYELIDIVPFGLPSRQPEQTAPAMKGVIPGIGSNDLVILWGGGLWEWLDPLSLVRAAARLAGQRHTVRLVFPATRHPNPAIPDMPMRRQTKELSAQLGLTNKIVFFGDWVPYETWPNYLLDADIGASLHFDTLETHFAFRTRILDYIWAGLPMVVTGGDSTSELVEQYGLGEVIPANDTEALAAAIGRMLETPALRETYRPRFERVRPEFTWERACAPIVRFCENPRFAPDRAAGLTLPHATEPTEWDAIDDAELVRLRSLVAAYEDGRFMKLMRQVHNWREKVGF